MYGFFRRSGNDYSTVHIYLFESIHILIAVNFSLFPSLCYLNVIITMFTVFYVAKDKMMANEKGSKLKIYVGPRNVAVCASIFALWLRFENLSIR